MGVFLFCCLGGFLREEKECQINKRVVAGKEGFGENFEWSERTLFSDEAISGRQTMNYFNFSATVQVGQLLVKSLKVLY